MGKFLTHKRLPFISKPEYGGACSLLTFANIFNDETFLDEWLIELSNQKSFPGLTKYEECFVIESQTQDIQLEPVILVQSPMLKLYLESKVFESPENDKDVFVYCVTSIRSNPVDNKAIGHRYAVLTTKEKMLLIDSSLDWSYEVDIESIIHKEGGIIGVDIFFDNERQPYSFTKQTLSHLI